MWKRGLVRSVAKGESATDSGEAVADAARPRRTSLRRTLVLTHVLVGACVALIALLSAHFAQRRSALIEARSRETATLVEGLSSEVDGGFEEGFAYVLGQDREDRERFLRRFEKLRAGRAELASRADLVAEEGAEVEALRGSIDEAETAGRALFDRFDRLGIDLGETDDDYEAKMDALRSRFDTLTEHVRERAIRSEREAVQNADHLTILAAIAALVLAGALGSAFGHRLARPLAKLRDAAAAFGRGEVEVIDSELASSRDEIGDLARAFRDMSRDVTQLMSALERRNIDTRLVLDNVAQGLMTVDRGGVIAPEYSARVAEWFHDPRGGETLVDYLGRTDARFAAETAAAWDEVIASIMPLEVTLEQMPRKLAVGGEHFAFGYQPIGDAEEPDRFLVVVTNETREIEIGLADRSKRETLALFEQMLADRAGFFAFVDEASALVESIKSATPDELPALKRALHTLKGNCGLLGIESVARVAHDLETFVLIDESVPTGAQLATLDEAWSSVASKVQRLVGSRRHVLEVDSQSHADLMATFARGASRDELHRAACALVMEPTRFRLTHFAEQAAKIADQLGKPGLQIAVDGGDERVEPRRWSPFWAAFVHGVRNAIDHGIELPEERAAAGKHREGRIVLRSVTDDRGFVIEIQDDGRGIDWDAVRLECEVRNIPGASRNDLVRALLLDGFSTQARATTISGRGVGMGALACATEALGGTLVVDSEVRRGTTIAMVFPRGSTLPPPNESSTRPVESRKPSELLQSTS